MLNRIAAAAVIACALAGCVGSDSPPPQPAQDEVTFIVPADQGLSMMLPVYKIDPSFGVDPAKCAALIASLGGNVKPSSAKVIALVAMAGKDGRMHAIPPGNTACVGTANAAFVVQHPVSTPPRDTP